MMIPQDAIHIHKENIYTSTEVTVKKLFSVTACREDNSNKL